MERDLEIEVEWYGPLDLDRVAHGEFTAGIDEFASQ